MHAETIARQWRVPPALPVVKLASAAALLALGLLLADGDLLRPVLGGLGAAALVAWGVRDLVAPVRLAVDVAGITVSAGWARRQHLPWSAVQTIRVQRGRGFAGPALEIDTGDSLHQFGRLDLGADPAEVADALHAARPPAD
ncbi:PH domain-containing protein [Micromonospora sp. WMMD1082]|uniref:PH domain-containing protein n=1 Tax=Micromonospora sp. WMMD1082 TaxID=3016104 RepID=UPI00241786DB|nr:PH domain-containing protein [Micromonospora sp. WMMD1082]MDG4794613.1 PH domain-containing protein [Micromonospora sp. WMMD1082]